MFQKILETSVERLVMGIFFYQVAGLQPGPPNQNNFQREEGWRDKKVKRVVSDLPILVSLRGTTMVFREIFENSSPRLTKIGTQSPALFQNIFRFCTFLSKFSNLPFFDIFLPFFAFFSEKLHASPYFLE